MAVIRTWLALVLLLASGIATAAQPSLPAHVAALTGKRAAKDGPNCLNAVELWHRLARGQRWTAWRVLDRKLKDPRRFRVLKASERSKLGDVIVYRHGPDDLIEHGAVFVDQRFVWEKASADASSPWKLTTHQASARPYGHTIIERYRRIEL